MEILSIGVITGIEKLEEAVHDVGVVFREVDSMLNPLLAYCQLMSLWGVRSNGQPTLKPLLHALSKKGDCEHTIALCT